MVPPDMIYFSGRNIQMVDTAKEAVSFLLEHKQRRGILVPRHGGWAEARTTGTGGRCGMRIRTDLTWLAAWVFRLPGLAAFGETDRIILEKGLPCV